MFIDYVPLMLVNMLAGLFILAHFIYYGLAGDNHKKWAPAFAISGLIALITGFHMTIVWPLPGSYNIAFGECSILFGAIYLGTALAMSKGWELGVVAIYAFFAGLVSITAGIRIIDLKLTQAPMLSGIGFITTGLGGVFAYLIVRFRHIKALRFLGALILLMPTAVWAVIGYGAYWIHLKNLSAWLPLIFQKAQ